MPGAGGADGTPTALPPVVSAGEIVVDGRIVPNELVELAFNTSGEIAEVLVQEGDSVQAGDVIARLGNRETLEFERLQSQPGYPVCPARAARRRAGAPGALRHALHRPDQRAARTE